MKALCRLLAVVWIATGLLEISGEEFKLAIQPGSKSSYLLHPNGMLYVWGWNDYGQLGLGDTNFLDSPAQLQNFQWNAVAGGVAYTLGISRDGQLYGWGFNSLGTLGVGKRTRAESIPVRVVLPDEVTNWVAVAAGETHSLGLAGNGKLYAWGNNGHGVLGLGSQGGSPTGPALVPFPNNAPAWSQIACGHEHAFALASNGRLYGCGYNQSGQLGLGHTNDQSSFTEVPFPDGVTSWRSIAAGHLHSLALGNDGKLYACGSNGEGQLGIGYSSPQNQTTFIPISMGSGITNWQSISCGFRFSLALSADGRLFTWGGNSAGQIGNNTFVVQPFPVEIPSPHGAVAWQKATAGAGHVLAIADNGRLYSWGYAFDGALGNGEEAHRPFPAIVKGLGNFATLEPNPVILSNSSFMRDAFFLRVRSADPRQITLTSTPDFIDWASRGNFNIDRGVIAVFDPFATDTAKQFYRVEYLP